MLTLVSRELKKREVRSAFCVGQRVKLSAMGRENLRVMPHHPSTGRIAKPAAFYPDSIAVVRDGSKRPLAYHYSYWEPA